MITLIGWYNYDNSIFEGLKLFDSQIDTDALIDTIIMEYGEMEPLYNSAVYIKRWVMNWAKTHKFFVDRAVRVLNEEYNPLENYDRFEDWTETGKGSVKSGNSSDSVSQVSPDDGNGWFNESKATGTSTADTTSDNTGNHTGRIHGNIGVTTAQQMATAELELAKYNLYKELADMFATDLLLKIY